MPNRAPGGTPTAGRVPRGEAARHVVLEHRAAAAPALPLPLLPARLVPVPQHARVELPVHAGVRIDPRRAPDWIVAVVVANRRVGVVPVLRQEEEEDLLDPRHARRRFDRGSAGPTSCAASIRSAGPFPGDVDDGRIVGATASGGEDVRHVGRRNEGQRREEEDDEG